MRIGILETDPLNPELRARFGNYPQMFQTLLERASDDIPMQFSSFDVTAEEYPGQLDLCDGYLITGSRAGANDEEPWIRRLEEFIRECHRTRKPLIGICFGHQLIARALGGRVETAAQGWGVGVHLHPIIAQAPFMVPSIDALSLLVSHRDQVTRLPREAQLLARSSFCPIAIYQIGQHIYAQQSHPEFVRDYARARLDQRREILGEERYGIAVRSLDESTDEVVAGRWMVNFLIAAIAARRG